MLNAKSTAKQARLDVRRLRCSQRDARQWFSLFGGELFVNLAIYMDESGTHDPTGLQPQSQVAAVAGYVGRGDSWIAFKRHWEAILDKYSARCFHFTQLQYARRVAEKSGPWPARQKANPYQGWPKQKCDDFLLECAKVAASGGRIPAGGDLNTRGYAEYVKRFPEEQERNPYEWAVWQVYEATLETVRIQWPKLQGPITFCFDQTKDPNWRTSIMNVHASYQKLNPRIAGVMFGNKEHPCCFGLQAADLVAGRLRQLTRLILQYDETQAHCLSELDQILFSKYGPRNLKELLSFRNRAHKHPPIIRLAE